MFIVILIETNFSWNNKKNEGNIFLIAEFTTHHLYDRLFLSS